MDNILPKTKEIKRLSSEEQVNKYLNKGWKLVYIGQFSDPPSIYGTEFILVRTE